MSYEKVAQASNRIVGTKQTLRALNIGNALEVIVAADADPRITSFIIAVANEKGISATVVDSKKQLGKACGIDVGATAVTITQ